MLDERTGVSTVSADIQVQARVSPDGHHVSHALGAGTIEILSHARLQAQF